MMKGYYTFPEPIRWDKALQNLNQKDHGQIGEDDMSSFIQNIIN